MSRMVTSVELLAIAAKEIGTKESPANSNRVKYNTWYYGREVSGPAYPWCMAFAQWCYAQAGVPLPFKTASCGALLRWYAYNQPECITKEPIPGALVIFDFPGGADTDHVGLLEGIGSNLVTTIDGNTGVTSEANGGCVMRRTREKRLVKAFITPKQLVEEDDYMTGEEIYKELNTYLGKQGAPDWARNELQEAIEMKITDGTLPMQLIPRYQAAIMAKRAAKKAVEEVLKNIKG